MEDGSQDERAASRSAQRSSMRMAEKLLFPLARGRSGGRVNGPQRTEGDLTTAN